MDLGHRVLAIARRPIELPGALTSWTADLADAAPVAARLHAWLAEQDPHTIGSASLINNAGIVSQLAPLSMVNAPDLSNALRRPRGADVADRSFPARDGGVASATQDHPRVFGSGPACDGRQRFLLRREGRP